MLHTTPLTLLPMMRQQIAQIFSFVGKLLASLFVPVQ